jgi:hypothetical protein
VRKSAYSFLVYLTLANNLHYKRVAQEELCDLC